MRNANGPSKSYRRITPWFLEEALRARGAQAKLLRVVEKIVQASPELGVVSPESMAKRIGDSRTKNLSLDNCKLIVAAILAGSDGEHWGEAELRDHYRRASNEINDYLLPKDALELAAWKYGSPLDIYEATIRVAGWEGDSSLWHPDPKVGAFDQIAWSHQHAGSVFEKNIFLLLLALASVKESGTDAVLRFFGYGYGATLGRLANGDDSWLGSAAAYLSGKLLDMRSVLAAGTSDAERFTVEADRHRRRVLDSDLARREISLKAGFPLPGVMSETDDYRLDSPSADAFVKIIPPAARYATCNAIALAHHKIERGDVPGAQADLGFALQTIAAAETGQALDRPRKINLELNSIAALVFLRTLRRTGRQEDHAVLSRIQRLMPKIDEAASRHEISGSKALEWKANIEADELAYRECIKERADEDRAFGALEEAVRVRRGVGVLLFRYDPIYRLALTNNKRKAKRFDSILSLDREG